MDGTNDGRAWRDRKRYCWVLGLLAPACALLPSTFVRQTGIEAFWWIGPVIVFVCVPILDALVGDDGVNPPDSEYERLSNDKFYRWCTYLFLPVLLSGLVVAAHLWASSALDVTAKIGLAITVGLVSGIGINAAHELGHRTEKHERWLAKVALAQSFYGHWYVEHNRGHHVRVATPEDCSSARFGENLWAFLPRSIAGGFISAWRLEIDRLRRKGQGPITFHNNILQAWALSAALFGTLLAVFGLSIAPYLALQAAIAFTMLETVNYVEHYGLLRARLASGRYERTLPRHSWNSDRLVTNVFLFHLQRHSDHHANPARRYQTLRSAEEAPQLPAGYPTMIMLAMCPPLWRAVMDHRVVAHYDGDISKANLAPRLRKRILASDKGFIDAA